MEDIFGQVRKILAEMPEPDEEVILTDEQVDKIILSLAYARGEQGFTEDEVVKVVKWCEDALIRESLVNLVLGGYADINWVNDEEGPSFKATPKGLDAVKESKNGFN